METQPLKFDALQEDKSVIADKDVKQSKKYIEELKTKKKPVQTQRQTVKSAFTSLQLFGTDTLKNSAEVTQSLFTHVKDKIIKKDDAKKKSLKVKDKKEKQKLRIEDLQKQLEYYQNLCKDKTQ